MPKLPVDPYRGTGRRPTERMIANEDNTLGDAKSGRGDTITRMESQRPELVRRARKREVTYEGRADNTDAWVIKGEPKFRDSYDSYRVTKGTTEFKYDCACYHTSHGDTRSRRICSHVMAVILWKKENPDYTPRSNGVREEADEVNGEDAKPVGSSAALSTPPARIHLEDVWSPNDERLNTVGEPVPEWVTSYRDTQWQAALETVEAFNNGARVVFCDAPTGSGKTLYGDLVARLMRQPAIYMCTTKGLQDQILHDFPYARVLKGRANYPTLKGPADVTCDDCDGSIESDDCSYCSPVHACPYRRAKAQAIRSQLAVVNVAYWLREANFVGAFSLPPDPEAPLSNSTRPGARRRREGGLFIVDECDTMEDQLLGFVEFSLTRARLHQLGLQAPKKGVHKPTITAWLHNDLIPVLVKERQRFEAMSGLDAMRRARGLATVEMDAQRIAASIESDNWIRDYSNEERVPFAFKPVRVDGYGGLLWNNMGRTVMMSATIISPEEMARTLGLESDYAVVRMPMAFPVENRRIRVAPVATMTRDREKEETPKLLKAIERILEKHPTDRTLIHTVSYGRAKTVIDHLRAHTKRPIVSYLNAQEREASLLRYRKTVGAVMVAPSFERGVDLKGDDCRVQIICKVPYPNMGDPRVSQRSHGPDGDAWMGVQTIRSLVQMTGRAVRTADDWCESYILDAHFKQLVKRNGSLLPEWWRDALDNSFRVKDLL